MVTVPNDNKLNKTKAKITSTRTIFLGFLVVILLGSVILSTPIANADGKWLFYVDSFFTATSAVCVTGLVVVDTANQFSLFGEIVILFLIQIGGLGFMTFATLIFIMVGRKIGLTERLAIKESMASFSLQGMVKLIKIVALITIVIEGIGAILLSITFIPEYGLGHGIYMSIFHSISAFCNAGFDILGTSANPYQGYSIFATNVMACLPLMMLIVIGGLGFAVVGDIISKHKWGKFGIHTRVVLVVSGVLIMVGATFYLISEYNNPLTMGNMNFGQKLLASLFQSITTRTAGFSTISQVDMNDSSKLFTQIMMFIGASPGSTGGGVKTTVFFVVLMALASNLQGKENVVISKRHIPQKRILRATAILFFGLIVVLSSSILLMIAETGKAGMDYSSILFEVGSAFGTVGLTTGITSNLSIFSKIVLCITMFLGRVGPLTVGYAIIEKNLSTGVQNNIKYPEAKILLG